MDNLCIKDAQSSDPEQPVNGQRGPKDRLKDWGPLATMILFSLLIVLVVTWSRTQVEAIKGYGYLGVFIFGFLGNATVILPAPSLALTTAMGGVLDPLLVGIAAGAGETLGETIGYLAGVGSKRLLDSHAHYETVQRYMKRFGAWVFFVLAAIPNPLFDVAGIVGGMVRFPVWKFLLSAWAGKTLKAILFAGAGHQFLA